MSEFSPLVPMDGPKGGGDLSDNVALQRQWRNAATLSSIGARIEALLESAGFDRGPWVVVAFGAGIALWFVLPSSPWWVLATSIAIIAALGAQIIWGNNDARAALRLAVIVLALAFACGVAIIWARSSMVGTPALERPQMFAGEAVVLSREEQPAKARLRLVLAIRGEDGTAQKIRVNLGQQHDRPGLAKGALIRLRTRLMPPAAPMLPGAYNFARTAWFDGLVATGSVIGPVEIIRPSAGGGFWEQAQQRLSAHIRARLGGASGSIAATLASGDRGAISERDQLAMRDSGLTHLLSISGLHVSAVIAAVYLLAMRILALWPALVLRVRLPIIAASLAAIAGICYTLLTGSQVPTIRSCVGAVLVLIALALGREPLSMRMVALAAGFVLILWPESIVGPSFQMSFTAVLAIIALHASGPVRAFLAPREENGWLRLGRRALMLLMTGIVIEMALMPIVLFHFHRSGIYGAFANVIAIPLVTFISMPLIALALLFDMVGLGAPLWWCVGVSLDMLLAIAHFTASQPGSVKLMPQMSGLCFALFIIGGLWLVLWRGRRRLWGLVPAALASALLVLTPVPDLFITGDGRHVALRGEAGRLWMLRESKSSFTRDNFLELAAVDAEPLPLTEWPGARCGDDFCAIAFERDGRVWHLLLARSDYHIDAAVLAQACARSDIVVAPRWLPRNCVPRALKADMRLLSETGGLALMLRADGVGVNTVAEHQGAHGWWQRRSRR